MLSCSTAFPLAVAWKEWNAPLLAFPLTVAIEWPLLAWWSGRGLRRTGIFCLFINGVSWGFGMGLRERWGVPVPPLEGAIILVEAGMILHWYRWPWQRALLTSAGMNLASWLFGSALLSLILRNL